MLNFSAGLDGRGDTRSLILTWPAMPTPRTTTPNILPWGGSEKARKHGVGLCLCETSQTIRQNQKKKIYGKMTKFKAIVNY